MTLTLERLNRTVDDGTSTTTTSEQFVSAHPARARGTLEEPGAPTRQSFWVGTLSPGLTVTVGFYKKGQPMAQKRLWQEIAGFAHTHLVVLETDEEHFSDPDDAIASNYACSDLCLYLKPGQRAPVQTTSGLRRRKRSPAWLAATEGNLQELLTLPANWNSYGARTIRPDVVDAATQLLRRVARPHMPQPIVVPTVRGGVQLEWHIRGIDFEIEINTPDCFQILYVDSNEGVELEYDLSSSDAARLTELLAKLPRR